MIKRTILVCVLGLGVVLLGACSMPSDTSSKNSSSVNVQPNVVFILVDDMGFGDVGYNGSDIATPNLDQMANDGVQLNHNYVYPICSPTRAALLTGHNPMDYGIDGPMGDHTGLPLDLKIMPEYFKDLGYQTFMIGKWHLGIGNTDYWPSSRGFDSHYGFLGGWVDFYTHMYSGGLDWQSDGKSIREEGHATDLLTAEAIRKIETRDPNSPMFMYLTYNAPHSPLQHPPEYSGLNDYDGVSDRSVYAEMVTHADIAIGSVIDVLEEQGILDNTIVIFSSDNGGAETAGADNGILRNGKGSAFEGGMRVPGLIWWPGHVEGGRVMDQPIAVYDWLPTLLDAVDSDNNAIDPYGISMWDAITTDKPIERGETYIGVANSRMAMEWPWKAVRQLRGNEAGEYLFNIEIDPSEQANLSEQYPEKLAELIDVIDGVPDLPSKGNPPGSKRPESFFRNAEDGWNYDVRVPETLEPWAEAATRGNKNVSQ